MNIAETKMWLAIQDLKQQLSRLDYVDNKFTEALVIKEMTGDDTKLKQLWDENKDVIGKKDKWRDRINELEKQILEGKQQ